MRWSLFFGVFCVIYICEAKSDNLPVAFSNDTGILQTQTAHIRIPIQSWKTQRDSRIVKQDLDYSCSAASLATLLNEFYGQSVTEEALLKAMDKGDLRASFEDMQKALPAFANDAPMATPLSQFTAQDTQMLFEQDTQPMQLAALSSQEMKDTEGAWVYYAVGGGIGFVTGNYTYLVNSAFDRNATWSWSSYARTVGASTAVGVINPVSSIRGAATAAGSSFISAWQFR